MAMIEGESSLGKVADVTLLYINGEMGVREAVP